MFPVWVNHVIDGIGTIMIASIVCLVMYTEKNTYWHEQVIAALKATTMHRK